MTDRFDVIAFGLGLMLSGGLFARTICRRLRELGEDYANDNRAGLWP